MKLLVRIIFASFVLLAAHNYTAAQTSVAPTTANGSGKQAQAEKEKARKKKQELKAQKKLRKQHLKIQSKDTRKRMKKTKKKSTVHNENRRSNFIRRWLSKKK